MKKEYILIGILSAVLFYTLITGQDTLDLSPYQNRIERLERKVDSLHRENDTLIKEVVDLENALAKYDQEIVVLENQIIKITDETDEKLRNVDFLTSPELEEFFSERYNSETSSTSGQTHSY